MVGVQAGGQLGSSVGTAEIEADAVTLAKINVDMLHSVHDETLSAAATTHSITGLDIDTDGQYFFIFQIENNAGAAIVVRMNFNTDTTAANYYTQNMLANNTAVSGARANSDQITGSLAAGADLTYSGVIQRVSSGNINAEGNLALNAPSSWVSGRWSIVTTGTAANLTSIEIVSDTANGLKIGSRFRVFKSG
jgi:hypothetical protein